MLLKPLLHFSRVALQLLLMLTLALAAGSSVQAQEEELFEDEQFRQGLIGSYQDQSSHRFQRIDPVIAFQWQRGLPDARLSLKPFQVQWRGYLMSQSPGVYRLYIHAAGAVEVKLRDRTVLQGELTEAGWLASEPVELSFDWHPLEISYQQTGPVARVALYWSGPQFQLEPVTERYLYHDPQHTPSSDFERGDVLASALRCAACHSDVARTPLTPAPAIDRLRGNIDRQWLVSWLAAEEPAVPLEQEHLPVTRRMPYFGFSREDAQALTAYLLAESPAVVEKPPAPRGDALEGQQLFLTLGCLACHRNQQLGASGLFGGGDLSQVSQKRPAHFFERWLANPAQINSHHRMPVFDLSQEQRQNLAAYLATLGTGSTAGPRSAAGLNGRATSPELVDRGKALYQQHGCAQCHQDTREERPTFHGAPQELTAEADWRDSCAGAPQLGDHQPGYQLSAADRRAIEQYLTALAPITEAANFRTRGEYLLAENNCLACHGRGKAGGLREHLPRVGEHHPELAPLLPAMTPPPLVSVGDKLHDQALARSIARTGEVHRDWLLVRMPKYRLTEDELNALVQYFVETDRIPAGAPHAKPTEGAGFDQLALEAAGRRLVTPDGFGCTSCHQIGKVKPPKAPLNAMGPDLSLIGERIRQPWFDRWVRNPARIIPRMEMPAVQIAVQGVLDETVEQQLAAVWHVLNEPGFEPPEPDPVRVVRRSGVAQRGERTAVLTDVLRADGKTYIKPLLLGLPNRHNILFDLDQGRLDSWWIGDVARQRTEGKTWFWESGGVDLLQAALQEPDIAVGAPQQLKLPIRRGQFVTEFDEIEHSRGGIVLRHRLFYEGAEEPMTVQVLQTLEPIGYPGQQRVSGFRRTIQLSELQPGQVAQVRVVSSARAAQMRLADNGRALVTPGQEHLRIELEERDGQFNIDGTFSTVCQPGQHEVTLRLRYLTQLPVDRFELVAPEFPPPDPVALRAVPGFEATRLPLPHDLMPTALAWQPDGTLVVSSLKGRVWLARDTNGDALEDRLQVYSDELAAPYGMQTAMDYVDVINKYALLRLWDEDGDGRAERTQTIASGWGHTEDYHDWAIGLPRDEQDNYYVALPCQQDERSAAAAHLRGSLLRLTPRQPTSQDPRLFGMEVVSRGHRFPMGFARSRRGELFVTDNQGNYNPFNELNHIVPEAHYGFINALERQPDYQPPLTPPAINIPHPWTRSVNGICFLDTPVEVRQRQGKGLYGPFEGHLIGCEYDTRMLVRMSLEEVAGTYQGAVYPFSLYHPDDGVTFLGPLCGAVAPDGDLYVGCIRDSGWGGANNIGGVVRMRPQLDQLPAGIAEVGATSEGFVIDFTQPVARQRAGQETNYTISSYTRVSTPEYGGADRDRRIETIQSIRVAENAQRVWLKLDELREGYIYELRLKNLAGGERTFFPAEAYYTLRKIP